MAFPLFFKIGTGQAGRQFLEKILFDEIGTMGLGNQPAIHGRLAVGRTEYFSARQRFPAAGVYLFAAVVKCDFD